MILVNYSGQSIYLLDDAPAWDSPFRAAVSIVTDTTTGLSNRETRRGYASTLRWKTTFSVTAQGASARKIVGALRAYQIEPVAVPVWPAVQKWSDRATATLIGGLKLVFKPDWSRFEIFEGVEPGWPAPTDKFVPLLVGRLEKRAVNWISADALTFNVDHTEASKPEWALSPAIAAITPGPNPSGAYIGSPALFPFPVNFDKQENSFTVSIHRNQIGFGREPLEVVYSQANAREQALAHILQGADIATLLYFFYTQGGGSSFWASNWVSALVLTLDVGPVDTILNVGDTSAISDGDRIAFANNAGIVATARIVSHTATTITVDVAPGALQASTTLVSHLLLTRFQKPTIALDWLTPDILDAKLPLREVPAEYTPAADETLSTTLGLLPTRCYLVELSRTLNGVTYTDRYTSFDIDLHLAGNTYAHAKLGNREIKQGIVLDRDEVQLDFPAIANSPLVLAATLAMEAPLFLTIIVGEVNVNDVENSEVLFTGEVVNVSVKGSVITAKSVTGSTMFDRPVPRVLFQRDCNNALFDVGCGLTKADWKFSAVMQDPGAPGYPFAFILNTLTAVGASASVPAVTANYFAGGWIELGAGANWQRRAILLNTVPAAGVLTVTLDRDPNPFPAIGDSVALFPGCDGSWATCQAKFNNALNFLGHPFLPLANPSLVKLNQTGAGGKK